MSRSMMGLTKIEREAMLAKEELIAKNFDEIMGAYEGEVVDMESEFHKAPFIPCGDKGSGFMQCPRCGTIGTYDTFIQVPCRWQEAKE